MTQNTGRINQSTKSTSSTDPRKCADPDSPASVKVARRRAVPGPVRHFLAIPAGTAAAVAAIVVAAALLGLETPFYVIALGALIGVSYGLLGVCLALIFRVSSVINFAQPAVGLFGLAFMPLLVQVLGLPFWVAFIAVIPIGFFTGALVDAIVIRRVQDAPRVVGVVATLGVAGVLASATGYVLRLPNVTLEPLPAPPGLPQFNIGPLLVSPGYTALIISAPILTAVLAGFLTRTRLGLAVLASASDPEKAKLVGVAPAAMSLLVWGIAGAISTITLVFFLGNPPSNPTAAVFSPETLLPALGAAAIGSFMSLPRTLAAGVVIGIAQQLMLWSPNSVRYSDLALLLILLGAMLAIPRARGRGEMIGAWTAVASWRALPAPLARLWLVRHYGRILLALLALFLLSVAFRNDTNAQSWTTTLCIAVISLSVALVTGLAGQLSLGQFGVALFGGGTSLLIVRETNNFGLGLLSAALAGGAVSLALAYPALRARGLTLTVLTLAFAIAVPTAFLADPHIVGPGVIAPQQPVLGGTEIAIGKPYLTMALIIAVVCLVLTWNTWRGGFGRVVRASRDNEFAAHAFGLPVLRSQLQLMFVSGVVAGVAGALLLHSYSSLTASSLPTDINIRVVLAVVMGGLGILYGGPLGVLWLFASAIAQATSSGEVSTGSNQAASLAIYSSALILILLAPGGAAQLLQPARDAIAVLIGRLHGVRYTFADLRGEKRLKDASTATSNGPADRREQNATDLSTAASRDAHRPSAADLDAVLPRRRPTNTPPAVAVTSRATTAGDRLAPPHAPIDERTTPTDCLLECRDLELRHGSIIAVSDMRLTVFPRQIVGLIGPNGAGKTSTFEVVTGFARANAGTVHFDGKDMTHMPPHRRAKAGLVRSFQNPQLFPTMSTLDVIMLALENNQPTNTVTSLLGVDLTQSRRRRAAETVIEFFGLNPYRESRVKELSTGTRRFVELAALIAMRPRLLLLDEPSSGVAQREIEELGPLLQRIRDEFDLAMVVIDHDIPLIMSTADHVVAMAEGRVLVSGTPAQVQADQRLIDAYLGGSLAAIHRSGAAATRADLNDLQEHDDATFTDAEAKPGLGSGEAPPEGSIPDEHDPRS